MGGQATVIYIWWQKWELPTARLELPSIKFIPHGVLYIMSQVNTSQSVK